MSEQLRDKMFNKLLEQEDNKPAFYSDKHNNATIGVGYTPVVKGEGGVWKVRPEVDADFKAAGITLSKEHKQALDELAYAKNNPKAEDAALRQKDALDKLGDVALDDKQAKALSGRLIDEAIEHSEKTLGKDRFAGLDEKRQLAIAGAAYQSPANVTKIGPDLIKAVDAKDWDKAGKTMEDSGKRLGDASRYKSYGQDMRDPAAKGKIQAKDGDNPSSLAKQHGVTLDELYAANPDLKKNGVVRAGDYLNIPVKADEKQIEQSGAPEQPMPTDPPASEEPAMTQAPVVSEEPQATEEPRLPAPEAQPLGADGNAFLEKMSAPNARPGLEIALKPPAGWSEDEAKTVIDDYTRYRRNDDLNRWLRDRASEHFKARYGEANQTKNAQAPLDPKAAEKALEQLGGRLAPAFDADGQQNATKAMQRGLNILNGDTMPKLKEDGDWGPITGFGFKKAAGDHGVAKVEEGFAAGRLYDVAARPQTQEDLAKSTRDILAPLYGSQEDGKTSEPHHAIALQAGLNEIGPDYVGNWQDLKLDGDIGPKTTDAFNSVTNSAGPQAFASDFADWLMG